MPVKAVAVLEDGEEESIDSRCQQVMVAVTDRRENGGTTKQIRSAALNLLGKLVKDLHSDLHGERNGNV